MLTKINETGITVQFHRNIDDLNVIRIIGAKTRQLVHVLSFNYGSLTLEADGIPITETFTYENSGSKENTIEKIYGNNTVLVFQINNMYVMQTCSIGQPGAATGRQINEIHLYPDPKRNEIGVLNSAMSHIKANNDWELFHNNDETAGAFVGVGTSPTAAGLIAMLEWTAQKANITIS